MEVCGESNHKMESLGDIIGCQPDVVVMEIPPRSRSGMDFLKAIRTALPAIRIVVLSMHSESLHGLSSIRAGAHAYCMKQDPPERVVEAIRTVCKGGLSVSGSLTSYLLQRLAGAESKPGRGVLTKREIEVAELIGAGMTTREIAEKLHLSVKTIEGHRMHIKDKFNLRNANQLVQACTYWLKENSTDRL